MVFILDRLRWGALLIQKNCGAVELRMFFPSLPVLIESR